MHTSESTEAAEGGEDARARIVAAAATLIAAGGPDAATTRAVSAAAGVQPPTIYRLFGDKRGLLDAVAEAVLASYVARKGARATHPDPVEELRRGWDEHVEFGLTHAGLFVIMSGDLGPPSSAVVAGEALLRQRVRQIAQAGRLKVSEGRAVAMLQAAGLGTVLTLLKTPEAERELDLSAAAREAVVAAITGEPSAAAAPGPRGAASALRASLDQTAVLSAGERHLLEELLDRIADGGSRGSAV